MCRPDRMCWIVCKFLCHILWVYLSYLPGWPSLVSSVITNDQSGFFSVHSSFNYCWDERCTVNTPHAASLAPASRFKIILISGFFTLCTFLNTHQCINNATNNSCKVNIDYQNRHWITISIGNFWDKIPCCWLFKLDYFHVQKYQIVAQFYRCEWI